MSALDTPVRNEDRLDYMDVLRGFAVMAIFIVNIKAMIAPFSYYQNPTLWSGDNDMLIANLQAYFVDNKWRTIFTALFGAGLVLISSKAQAAGGSITGRMLKRNIFLLIFGLMHLLLVWEGDILTGYALVGFVALLFTQKSAKSLTIWAIVLFILSWSWMALFSLAPMMKPEILSKMSGEFWGTDPEVLKETVEIYLGSYAGILAHRAVTAVEFIVFYFLMGGFAVMTLAIMLGGMALFKSGFLKGTAPIAVYGIVALLGLGAMLGLEHIRVSANIEAGWTFEDFSVTSSLTLLAGPAGALGYAALIALLMKLGLRLPPVSAVGRMAFTNYIACSLIGTTIAYGYGFSQYTALSLQQGMMIVGATFVAMLIWSPLWLSAFRFGPLEWLWRSLTYGKIQPLRK